MFSLGLKSQENVYYIEELSFPLCSQREHTQFLLCCVIAADLVFIVVAVGREQFTDARKKGNS